MNLRRIHINLTLVPLLGAGVFACVSIIDFESTGDQHELVIFGRISNASTHDQAISVRRSDLDSLPGLPFDNAIVEVVDDLENTYPYSFSSEEGRYLPDTRFTGTPGVTYQAFVTLGATTYSSTPQKMPLAGAIDTTYFEFERRERYGAANVLYLQYYMQVLTDSRLSELEEPMFLKWDVDEVYVQPEMILPAPVFPFYERKTCYVFKPYIGPNILLFNGEEVQTNMISRQVNADVILNSSFTEIRSYRIVQSSFSKEAYNYWSRVDDMSSRGGSLFDIPPAPVAGNFQNVEDPTDKPLGFFEVSKMDTTGVLIEQGDLPVTLLAKNVLLTCPQFSLAQFVGFTPNCLPCLEEFNVVEGCYDCLSLPNSTTQRPSFLD